jgi:hypothetical protein
MAADTDAAEAGAMAEAMASMVLRLSWRREPVPAAGGTPTASASAGIDIESITLALCVIEDEIQARRTTGAPSSFGGSLSPQ